MRIESVGAEPYISSHRGGASGAWQTALLLLVLGVGLSLILATVQVKPFTTALLYVLVMFLGLQRCRATQRKLLDPKLNILNSLWPVKLALTLYLLHVGWIPELEPTGSSEWGYDPQRYYRDAFDLIENNWNPTVGLNYQGILFFYGAIFYLLGHNPVIPALINNLVTLLGTLYLIRLAYEFKGNSGPRDWILAFALLIPELLWYDIMTSRETLMAVLILVALLATGRYIVHSSCVSLKGTMLLVSTCLAVILGVRTIMAIPVVVSIGIMIILLKRWQINAIAPKMIILGLVVALVAMGPMLQLFLGGHEVDYVGSLWGAQSFERSWEFESGWSEKSIGLLLVPNNTWQAVLFAMPRMIIYLVVPLPNYLISITDLSNGSWSAWQHLIGILSSGLNILLMPYTIAGFAWAYKQRAQKPAQMVLHLAFWVMFIMIAGGSIIIHERYRVMVLLLLFGCAWSGYTSQSKGVILKSAIIWYIILGAAGLFYISYKG